MLFTTEWKYSRFVSIFFLLTLSLISFLWYFSLKSAYGKIREVLFCVLLTFLSLPLPTILHQVNQYKESCGKSLYVIIISSFLSCLFIYVKVIIVDFLVYSIMRFLTLGILHPLQIALVIFWVMSINKDKEKLVSLILWTIYFKFLLIIITWWSFQDLLFENKYFILK